MLEILCNTNRVLMVKEPFALIASSGIMIPESNLEQHNICVQKRLIRVEWDILEIVSG